MLSHDADKRLVEIDATGQTEASSELAGSCSAEHLRAYVRRVADYTVEALARAVLGADGLERLEEVLLEQVQRMIDRGQAGECGLDSAGIEIRARQFDGAGFRELRCSGREQLAVTASRV